MTLRTDRATMDSWACPLQKVGRSVCQKNEKVCKTCIALVQAPTGLWLVRFPGSPAGPQADHPE